MELFDIMPDENRLRQTPTLVLAYVGDGVYELLARTHLAGRDMAKVSSLHRRVVALTRAEAQAAAAQVVLPMLCDEERAVFIRGRNAKPHSAPRNATAREYALATALEALFGWLWLGGRAARLKEIWEAVLKHFEAVD